jgi:hypothetical protein
MLQLDYSASTVLFVIKASLSAALVAAVVGLYCVTTGV